METRNKEQLRNFGIACKPIANLIKNFAIENWRLLLVDVVGIYGLYFALCLCASSGKMIGDTLPMEYYRLIFVGSIVYGMLIFYQMLKFNGQAAILKIKEARKIRNYSEKL